MNLANCPVCSGKGLSKWEEKMGGGVAWTLVKCAYCKYVFVNPRPTPEVLNEYYGSLSRMTSSHQPMTFEDVIKAEGVYPNSTIDAARIASTAKRMNILDNFNFLDVGCGYGFFSSAALKEGFVVQAIEIAPTERRIAKEIIGFLPETTTFEKYEGYPNHFSVVLMSQTLEHALDVNKWIDKANVLLASKGILVIAVPNFGSIFSYIMGVRDPFISPPAHLNYFKHSTLKFLLQKHGFRVEKVEYVSRLPLSTLIKRLKVPHFMLPAFDAVIKRMLWIFDGVGVGMIINVYARKL